MKIIYFQGWGEKFDEKKFKILSKFGDEILYPNINYENDKNIISNYVNSDNRYSLIVGNSIGAYMAFYISNLIHRPSLLFNPTFFLKNGTDILPWGDILNHIENKNIKIILSLKDEKLNFKKTLQYLNTLKLNDEIKIYNELYHDIPLDIFEKEFEEFRKRYENIDRKEKEEIYENWWEQPISKKIIKTEIKKVDYLEQGWVQPPG